jgi:hypothetical protein
MQITLSDAIQQIRAELRKAAIDGADQDIVFTPTGVDIELAVTFEKEAKAGGGFKVLAFLDLSTEAKASQGNSHKIKLSLSVANQDGTPFKVKSEKRASDLP